jgi:hypothetical protein
MAESMAAWRALVACAIVPMAGLAIWRSRQRAIHGTLLFDAGRWALSRGAGAVMTLGRTRTCVDLQRFLLIHVEVAGRRQGHWLWADRDADPEHWRDLRRALHAKSDTSESVTPRQGERAIST